MRHFISVSALCLGLLACHGPSDSKLDIATHKDAGPTRVVKIPYFLGEPYDGYIPLLITPDYNSKTPRTLAYRIICRKPEERQKFLKDIGVDTAYSDLELAYSDPNHPDPKYAAYQMEVQPALYCPSDRAALGEPAAQVKQDPGQLNPHLRFAHSVVYPTLYNYYEVGCRGLLTGLGYDLKSATAFHVDEIKNGDASAENITINCPKGEPFVPDVFANECEAAVTAEEPTPAQQSYLRLLDIHGLSVSECGKLKAQLKDVKTLDLSDQDFADLTALKQLPRLENLSLRYNGIQDLSPIAGLTNMRKLDLASNQQLVDLRPLSELTKLGSLNLSDTSVTDLSALKKMWRLEQLDVSDNPYIRAVNLDPLKHTKVRNPILTNTTIRWEASEQTFFTNCLFYSQLPDLAQASYKAILESASLSFAETIPVTCDILYRHFAARKVLDMTGKGPSLDPEVIGVLKEFPNLALKLD